MLRGLARGSSGNLRSLASRQVNVAELPIFASSQKRQRQQDNVQLGNRLIGSGASCGDLDAADDNKKKFAVPAHRHRAANRMLKMTLFMFIVLLSGMYALLRNSSTPPRISRFDFLGVSNDADGVVSVEFAVPGLFIPVKDALDIGLPFQGTEKLLHDLDGDDTSASIPKHRSIFHENTRVEISESKNSGRTLTAALPSNGSLATSKKFSRQLQVDDPAMTSLRDDDRNPESSIRLLVAVTSACCSSIAAQRREAVRRTWGRLARDQFPREVRVAFFLTQPPDPQALDKWLPVIENEVRRHNDTVILRGADTYKNLPNKVFRTLRYTLAHPSEYTHIFKTDDDTWVRMHRVMEVLHESTSEQQATQTEKAATTSARPALKDRVEEKLREKSKQTKRPIISDSMQLYDATAILNDARDLNKDYTVDTIDGSSITIQKIADQAGLEKMDSIMDDDDHGDKHNEEFHHDSTSASTIGNGKKHPDVKTSQSTHEGRALQVSEKGTEESLRNSLTTNTLGRPRLHSVYLGSVENHRGFNPIREPSSKWYISHDDLPDAMVPKNVKYVAGWGYVLSTDLIGHVAQKVNAYERNPESAPPWFSRLNWEDVLVGLLLADVVVPEDNSGFRSPWRSCTPSTAVKHLDIDSPRLLAGLLEQDVSGLADIKPVQCSSGEFLPGDYWGWKSWRDSLDTK